MVTVVVLGQTLRQLVDEDELELEVGGPTTVRALLEANTEKMGGLLALLNKGEIMLTVNRKVGALESTPVVLPGTVCDGSSVAFQRGACDPGARSRLPRDQC